MPTSARLGQVATRTQTGLPYEWQVIYYLIIIHCLRRHVSGKPDQNLSSQNSNQHTGMERCYRQLSPLSQCSHHLHLSKTTWVCGRQHTHVHEHQVHVSLRRELTKSSGSWQPSPGFREAGLGAKDTALPLTDSTAVHMRTTSPRPEKRGLV